MSAWHSDERRPNRWRPNRTIASPKWSGGSDPGCSTSSAGTCPIRLTREFLQDVFYRLVEANRLLMPIEHVTGWLFRVARNRITDLFRKKEPENFSEIEIEDEDADGLQFEDLLPSPDDGPEALYIRSRLLDELKRALAGLTKEQRDVFIAHELEGRSFKELSETTGVSLNTLLSRKRYAVLHLREQLRHVYEEFGQ